MLHSDIPGSMLVCSSPRLFAACRVLLRLLMPRHPSCALCSLTTKISTILIACCEFLQFLFSTFSALTKLFCLPVWLLSFPYNSFLYLSMNTMPFIGTFCLYMVGVLGFEPRTSSLSGTRSNQLSYTPNRASRYDGNPVYLWWSLRDSNP